MVEANRFLDNQLMKMVGLSVLSTGRLNPQEMLLVLVLLEAESNPVP